MSTVDVEWDLRNLVMKWRARTLDRTECTSVTREAKIEIKNGPY